MAPSLTAAGVVCAMGVLPRVVCHPSHACFVWARRRAATRAVVAAAAARLPPRPLRVTTGLPPCPLRVGALLHGARRDAFVGPLRGGGGPAGGHRDGLVRRRRALLPPNARRNGAKAMEFPLQ